MIQQVVNNVINIINIKNKKKTLNGGLFLNGYMFYVTIALKVSYL